MMFNLLQVVNLVQSDPDIFAAGNCYDEYEFKEYQLFCPYAYRTDDTILVKVWLQIHCIIYYCLRSKMFGLV